MHREGPKPSRKDDLKATIVVLPLDSFLELAFPIADRAEALISGLRDKSPTSSQQAVEECRNLFEFLKTPGLGLFAEGLYQQVESEIPHFRFDLVQAKALLALSSSQALPKPLTDICIRALASATDDTPAIRSFAEALCAKPIVDQKIADDYTGLIRTRLNYSAENGISIDPVISHLNATLGITPTEKSINALGRDIVTALTKERPISERVWEYLGNLNHPKATDFLTDVATGVEFQRKSLVEMAFENTSQKLIRDSAISLGISSLITGSFPPPIPWLIFVGFYVATVDFCILPSMKYMAASLSPLPSPHPVNQTRAIRALGNKLPNEEVENSLTRIVIGNPFSSARLEAARALKGKMISSNNMSRISKLRTSDSQEERNLVEIALDLPK